MIQRNLVQLYGLVTDKTRKLLEVTGWKVKDGLWLDPVSNRCYTEPEATVIQLKRLDASLHPEKGIDAYLRRHGHS